jgi:hypothetical protein
MWANLDLARLLIKVLRVHTATERVGRMALPPDLPDTGMRGC